MGVRRERTVTAVDQLGLLFPRVIHAVNVVMEKCTEGVSKNTGACLWVLSQSQYRDKAGDRYLATADLKAELQRVFAVSGEKAQKVVSDAKREMFDKDLIDTHSKAKRIYLTPRGEKFVARMIAKAKSAIRLGIGSMDEQQRR